MNIEAIKNRLPFSIGTIEKTENTFQSSTEMKVESLWKNFSIGIFCGIVAATAYCIFNATMTKSLIMTIALIILIKKGEL